MLGLMDKKYQRLGGFAAAFDERSSDNPDTPVLEGQIAFRRNPERAVALIAAPAMKTVLYDGSNVIVYPSPDAVHFTKTANYFRNLQGSGISTVLGQLVDDPRRDILSRLIAADYNSQHALEPFLSLDSAGSVVIDAIECDRVVVTRSDDTVTLMIGRPDHLLRRITWTGTRGGKPWYFFEDFSNVRTGQTIPASLFAFRPPSGITQYATTGQ